MPSDTDTMISKTMTRFLRFAGVALLLGITVACGSDGVTTSASATPDPTAAQEIIPTTTPLQVPDATSTPTPETTAETTLVQQEPETVTFSADVWADNWFALYVDGVLVGEDSVPITTERSFNKETITFDAAYPFTVAIEAKDFKETDSGIEYIGLNNQQMGDGGIIAQITDLSSGQIVSATNSEWKTFVVHRAPLNPECERAVDPDASCEFQINPAATTWADANFDDGAWVTATEWSEADVRPKDGYDQVSWDDAARLIWGADLEIDNTILLRVDVTSPAAVP